MRLWRHGSAEGQRGFALLIVMGAVGVLALLTARLNGAGRTEMQVATNLRANAVVEAAADGAVEAAVLQLLQGTWQPDEAPHGIGGSGRRPRRNKAARRGRQDQPERDHGRERCRRC